MSWMKELAEQLNYTVANLKGYHPNLTNDSGHIVGKCNPAYNCHGYAFGARRWLNLGGHCDGSYHEHARELGYRRTKNGDYKPGYRTLAVYADRWGVTHTAVRVRNGWRSKLGKGPIIFHKTLEDLAGGVYGHPVGFYERWNYKR